MVSVLPEIVAGPEAMLKVTGKADEADAANLIAGFPNDLLARDPKVIV